YRFASGGIEVIRTEPDDEQRIAKGKLRDLAVVLKRIDLLFERPQERSLARRRVSAGTSHGVLRVSKSLAIVSKYDVLSLERGVSLTQRNRRFSRVDDHRQPGCCLEHEVRPVSAIAEPPGRADEHLSRESCRLARLRRPFLADVGEAIAEDDDGVQSHRQAR